MGVWVWRATGLALSAGCGLGDRWLDRLVLPGQLGL